MQTVVVDITNNSLNKLVRPFFELNLQRSTSLSTLQIICLSLITSSSIVIFQCCANWTFDHPRVRHFPNVKQSQLVTNSLVTKSQISTSEQTPPPFATTFSTIVGLQTQLKTTKTIVNYFLQLGNVFLNCKLTKLIITSQECHYSRKCTCQHHNNSHYVPLLINLVEKCSTNIVEGCCQLHSTNG